MTTARLATALCANNRRDCVLAIIPPWKAGDDAPLCEAWDEVQELRRQWAGLIEIWPDRKDQFDRELDDKICEVAVKCYDKLYDYTP